MEATKEGTGLPDQIVPPRLEDAGLEDCALPPDLIKEAFLKAASAVKSRATSIFTDEDESAECVQEPWPEEAKFASDKLVGVPPVPGATDALVGIEMGKETPVSCVAEKGGGVVEEDGDKVVVVGGDVEEKENERGGCLGDGLKKKEENDPVVMPRVAKCSTAYARGSFKDVAPIGHKERRGFA
ncbi:hypothetical protein D5086_006344 [Populus alba]|uniref:Uncharacterized protein n=1 Tax=Populus alba TaxID=43335 RepID=A0ACC4CL33_POPAL